MNKKEFINYETPEVEIFEIQVEQTLLTDSDNAPDFSRGDDIVWN